MIGDDWEGRSAEVGANLVGANLSNAILAGAKLNQQAPEGVHFCDTLMPNGTVRNPQKSCE